MPYCSLEEAWGTNFKDEKYFAKLNGAPTSSSEDLTKTQNGTIHSRIPPEMSQKGLDFGNQLPEQKKALMGEPSPKPAGELPQDGLDNYFPSYTGGAPSVNHVQKMKSKMVPYEVSFPNNARRNYIYPVDQVKQNDDDSDNDSALDLLEDNDHDIRHIDRQRRLRPEYEPDYLTSQDYFLYKKYMKLAQKYKEKLKKRYKNFVDEEGVNPLVVESFGNMQKMQMPSNYSMKDMIVLIIVGIFIIFALDIFVKMGSRMKE